MSVLDLLQGSFRVASLWFAGPALVLALLVLALLVLALLVLAPVSTGQAQPEATYAGNWRGGAMQVSVQVESWGDDCGPRPRGSSSGGGGNFRVSEEGDQLVFHGARTRRTDTCWSDNPLVRRVSTSRREGAWTTICRTPPSDPRQETGTYTLRSTSEDRLSFQDISRYNWRLNASECVATVTSRQGFSRSATRPTPTPEAPTCTPGAPARLVVRPSSVEIAPGDRATFRAAIYDRAGCLVPGQTVRWELRKPPGLSAELRNGVFVAAETAAEAEGNFVIVATSGAYTREVRALVRTQDLSSLIAQRSERGALQPEADSLLEFDAGLSTEPTEEEPGLEQWGWAIGLGAGLLLALLAFLALVIVLLKRKSRRSQATPSAVVVLPQPGSLASIPAPGSLSSEPAHLDPSPAETGPARICPLCQAEYTNLRIQFCSKDGSPLTALADSAAPSSQVSVDPSEAPPALAGPVAPAPRSSAPHSSAPPAAALICSVCRRGYPGDATRCREHGETLMPYADFRDQDKMKRRVCPTCGTTYDQNRRFCGKDGSELKDQ